ncbi:MAG: hypothetical protein PCALPYG88_0652 [uncultured Paraburkholderia sp.]|nr:MAG: hypothetical protein PCALPYG08_1002 [uncultured Paraburkholderia sp.]CAH2910677.1 MAG: hypothetical protein PCALPYG88_0652 [uncultured Paraburkholderia sp.]
MSDEPVLTEVYAVETHLAYGTDNLPSSLTRWRKPLSEAGVEELLAQRLNMPKPSRGLESKLVMSIT